MHAGRDRARVAQADPARVAAGVRRAWRQRAIGRWVFFIPFCGSLIFFMKVGLGYRIRELRAVRAEFKRLTQDPRPLLVCSNHLTYLDPVLLIYAFANHWWYMAHYRYLAWNLPAVEYKSNPFFRLVCYAAKCLFINRKGSREHHLEVLGVARTLLGQGEVLNLFPEGRRSRTGRFDDAKLAYGVGRVVSELPECRVLCVYLRAETVSEKVGFPKRGTQFRLMREMVVFKNTPEQFGSRERGAEIVREIGAHIKKLEARYFEGVPSLNRNAIPGVAAEPITTG